MILPSSLASLSWNGTRVGPTAAVERAHSDRARSGSKGSARVSFHPFHRGGSASKKGTWPLLPHPSNGEYPSQNNPAILNRTMEQPQTYLRKHYRLPVTYPVMFAAPKTIGEGTITNLSVFGCTIECVSIPT